MTKWGRGGSLEPKRRFKTRGNPKLTLALIFVFGAVMLWVNFVG